MANDYTAAVFLIDTDTNLAGLTTLKGSAPALTDRAFVYSGAGLSISSTMLIEALYAGQNNAGASSTGVITVLAGAEVRIAGGASGGLYIDSLGQFIITGTSGSRGRLTNGTDDSASAWLLQQLDGLFQATEASIENVDVVAAIAGSLELDNCTMDIRMTATSELIVSGTMVLASSELGSDQRWALLNYGFVTMGPVGCSLRNAYWALACSTQSLIFFEDPTDIGRDNPARLSLKDPLGGTKARGKRLGRSGRRISLAGAFSMPNSGTDYLYLWEKLELMLSLNDSFTLTWSEGSINKCLLAKSPVKLEPSQVEERYYSLEAQEVA